MKLRDLKIGVQLTLGFSLMLLFVVILSFISSKQNDETHEQVEMLYQHPLQVRRALGSIEAQILTMRLATRDLMLAKDEHEQTTAYQQIDEAKAKVEQGFDMLYEKYLGPKADVDAAYTAYLKWNAARYENLKAIHAGEIDQVKESVKDVGSVGALRVDMLKKITVISIYSTNKANELYQNAVEIKQQLKTQLLIITLSMIFVSVLVIYLLLMNIRRPIKHLTEVIEQYKNGNSSVQSNIDLKNEFGILSEAFNLLIDHVNQDAELSKKTELLSDSMLIEDNSHDFFMELLPVLQSVTDSQLAAVYLLDKEQNCFKLYESIGMSHAYKNYTFSVDAYEGQFGRLLKTKEIDRISNIPADTQFVFQTVSGTMMPREIISMPILVGDTIVAIISIASVRSYSDKSLKLINKVFDVLTARVDGILAYRELRKSAKVLEQQKNELAAQSSELLQQNAELEIQKKKLDEVSRLKTNFLSNMSHELRTPLNSVIALSGVLSRRLANSIPADEYSYIEVIERNGKHLLSLINDILDISRIEAGKEEVEIEKINVDKLIADIVGMIEPQALQKKLILKHKQALSDIFVMSDSKMINHILQNLVGNAVKFTEKGMVEIYAEKNQSDVKISVADSGIGISEENMTHIFDEFQQADGSTSRRFGGTGLGLAIARKYATILGASIDVSSQLGKGSVFTLTLPLNFTNSNIELNEEYQLLNNRMDGKDLNYSGFGKRILIVEDSEPAIIQIKDLLEQKGYNVSVANSGSEALDLIPDLVPDGIILDLMMPDVDGFEVLRQIREDESIAHIPVLILTAKHITKDELKFLKSNHIHQLIQKGDVNKNDLYRAIAGMVNSNNDKSLLNHENAIALKSKEKPLILVVDDNTDNIITVRALLGDNYNILEANDSEKAIEATKNNKPDLVLMDISLPGVDGISTLKIIRQNYKSGTISVVALTANALPEYKQMLMDNGFDACIVKPIDENLFFETINRVLYGK